MINSNKSKELLVVFALWAGLLSVQSTLTSQPIAQPVPQAGQLASEGDPKATDGWLARFKQRYFNYETAIASFCLIGAWEILRMCGKSVMQGLGMQSGENGLVLSHVPSSQGGGGPIAFRLIFTTLTAVSACVANTAAREFYDWLIYSNNDKAKKQQWMRIGLSLVGGWCLTYAFSSQMVAFMQWAARNVRIGTCVVEVAMPM